jgi:hypothetical protein
MTLSFVVFPAVTQHLALWTTKGILGGVILELITSKTPMRLVAPINHRDVWLDASL